MSGALAGAVLGGVAAGGALLAASRVLRARRPSLETRVAPYIRDIPAATPLWSPREPSGSVLAAAWAIATPPLVSAGARLQRVLGGRRSVQRRLSRAGARMSVEQFRVAQVIWGLAAFAAALLIGVLGPARQPGRALPWLLLSLGAAGLGVMARDSLLSRQIRERERRMLAEFPAVADLLALAVAAGESPLSALDRVVRSCRGVLAEELARVVAETRTGLPVVDALDALAARTGLAIVARFADGISVAMARGTPLVEVLAAQAADVREAAKRELIETGARKEVAMMVPVVFILLPTTLLFAFYPGLVGLNLLAP